MISRYLAWRMPKRQDFKPLDKNILLSLEQELDARNHSILEQAKNKPGGNDQELYLIGEQHFQFEQLVLDTCRKKYSWWNLLERIKPCLLYSEHDDKSAISLLRNYLRFRAYPHVQQLSVQHADSNRVMLCLHSPRHRLVPQEPFITHTNAVVPYGAIATLVHSQWFRREYKRAEDLQGYYHVSV